MQDPEIGKLVIIKIKSVMPYGAIAELEEFPNYEGFLHVSEIVSKWVKNIGDYVKVGMRTAALVIEVDKNKKVATISLKRVSEEQRKKAFEDYENTKKARKIIETAIKKARSKITAKEIENAILEQYDNLHDFMLDIYDEGKEIAEEFITDSKVASMIEELVKKSYKKKLIELKLIINIETYSKNGVEEIKNALIEAGKYAEIKYIGAPRYMAIIRAEEYKDAKKMVNNLKQALSKIEKSANLFS
ncbi:MAG: S1 RNA-binding domain-containing protein, partial [Candidatus Anstonellales archaeon]